MELIKSLIFMMLFVAISSCTNTGEQKNTMQEFQTQELAVSKMDTIPEIPETVTPLFDSCILSHASRYGVQIVVNRDTIFVRNSDSIHMDYPISLANKNLITESINKLYIEKSVSEITGKRKYDPKYYEEYEWCPFYGIDIYLKGKEKEIIIIDEIYRGNDTIIHSPEYDNLIKTIYGITHDYTIKKMLIVE